jgi:methionyl-tRNA formyltransferase
LLPRWRGASPVAAAILAGDERTGVSLMRLEEGLDTGPVALQRDLEVLPADTTGSLTPRLADLGAVALLEALQQMGAGSAEFKPQPVDGVTHAGLVRKSDGDLTWDQPAAHIARALRAYAPWPGVRLPLGGEPVRVLGGRVLPAWTAGREHGREPGDVIAVDREGITVMAADAPFVVTDVQPAGRRAMTAAEYARGHRELRVSNG